MLAVIWSLLFLVSRSCASSSFLLLGYFFASLPWVQLSFSAFLILAYISRHFYSRAFISTATAAMLVSRTVLHLFARSYPLVIL